eukprot:jgi/Botrbrau1/19551/Bobra.0035s0043.1
MLPRTPHKADNTIWHCYGLKPRRDSLPDLDSYGANVLYVEQHQHVEQHQPVHPNAINITDAIFRSVHELLMLSVGLVLLRVLERKVHMSVSVSVLCKTLGTGEGSPPNTPHGFPLLNGYRNAARLMIPAAS